MGTLLRSTFLDVSHFALEIHDKVELRIEQVELKISSVTFNTLSVEVLFGLDQMRFIVVTVYVKRLRENGCRITLVSSMS